MKRINLFDTLYTLGLIAAFIVGGAGVYFYLQKTYELNPEVIIETHSIQKETSVVSEDSEPDSDSTCTCTLKTYRNEHLGDFSFDYLDTDWTLTETTTPKGAGQEYLPDDILITLANKHDNGKIEIYLRSLGGGMEEWNIGRCVAGTQGVDYATFGSHYPYKDVFTGWIRDNIRTATGDPQDVYIYAERFIPVQNLIELHNYDPEAYRFDAYINDEAGGICETAEDLPKTGYCMPYDATDFRIVSDIHIDLPKEADEADQTRSGVRQRIENDTATFAVDIQYTGPDIKSAEKVFKTIGGLQ